MMKMYPDNGKSCLTNPRRGPKTLIAFQLNAPTTFRRIVVLIALALMLSATGFAQPLPLFWVEDVNGQLKNGANTFPYSYTRTLDWFDASITKDVEIKFQKDPRDVWVDKEWNDYISGTVANIENLWDNKFSVADNVAGIQYSCKLEVTTDGPFNQTVVVRKVKLPGDPAYDATDWYVNEDKTEPYGPAHELGHMIGLYDEYAGGWQNPANPFIDKDGLMGSGTSKPLPAMRCRYYAQYRDFLQSLDPAGSFSLVQIPEPATLALLGIGAVGMLARRRRAA